MTLKIAFLGIAILVSGCASNHDLNEDGVNRLGGGGFRDNEIASGFYKLMIRTNSSLWTNIDGARNAWKKRATGLCGSSEFEEIKIHESSYNAATGDYELDIFPRIRTKRTGYVLCSSSSMTIDDALDYIKNRGKTIN